MRPAAVSASLTLTALALSVGCGNADPPSGQPLGEPAGGGGSGAPAVDGNAMDAGETMTIGDGTAPTPAGGGTTVTAGDDGTAVSVTNGSIAIRIDEKTGIVDYAWGGTPVIQGSYAAVALAAPTGVLKSTGAKSHRLAANEVISDAFGRGRRVSIDHESSGLPTIRQVFRVYEGTPFALVDEIVTSPNPIASNYLGALLVDGGRVSPGAGPDPRVLDVPFDNDAWVRFDARSLSGVFHGTGYEVGAVYEGASKKGLVVGSITHDFWKTGFYYETAKGFLTTMHVWGGAAVPDSCTDCPNGATYGRDGTHDVVGTHGAMTGTTLTSPTIFVGDYADLRDGMEAYAKANTAVVPAKKWSRGVAFGWSSWGAFGEALAGPGSTAASTVSTLETVSDKMAALGDFGKGAILNLDAWVKLSDSGGDLTPKLLSHVRANGQKLGTYLAPFAVFSSDPKLPDQDFAAGVKWREVLLKDAAGTPLRANGVYVKDVTHPLVRESFRAWAKSVVAQSYEFVKLDFLTYGSFEGAHADPKIHSGIQAYNQAMDDLTATLPANVFVDLSIAPIFPYRHAHARRLSCDVYGQLNDTMGADPPASRYAPWGSTEYMLNSLTFGWWEGNGLYAYGDPDAMALYAFEGQKNPVPTEWSKTRVTASAIAGTVFVDTTNYTDPAALSRSQAYLTHAGVNAVARAGVPFRPVDLAPGYVTAHYPGSAKTNSGSAATDAFAVARADGTMQVAVFNFDGAVPRSPSIELAKLGLDPAATYQVEDVWSGKSVGTAHTALTTKLAPGEAKLLLLRK